MSPIRIHLGPMPEMLRTIISDLLREEPDFVLVGRSAGDRDPLRAARDGHADVLITQDCATAPDTCLDMILAAAPIGIFALSADGQNAASVSVVRRTVALNSLKRAEFASAVRNTAQRDGALSAGKSGATSG